MSPEVKQCLQNSEQNDIKDKHERPVSPVRGNESTGDEPPGHQQDNDDDKTGLPVELHAFIADVKQKPLNETPSSPVGEYLNSRMSPVIVAKVVDIKDDPAKNILPDREYEGIRDQQTIKDAGTDLKEKHHLKSQTSPKVNVADSAVVKDEPAQPISSDRGNESARDVASDQQGIVGADMKQKPVCKKLPDDKVDLQSSMRGLEGQIQPENLENKPADIEKELAQLRSKDGECKSKEKVKYQLTEGQATVTAVIYTPHSDANQTQVFEMSPEVKQCLQNSEQNDIKDKHERPLSPVRGNESMSDEPPGHQQDNDDDKTDLKEKHHLKSQTSLKVNVADAAVVKDEPAQPISSDRGNESVRDVVSDQQGIVGADMKQKPVCKKLLDDKVDLQSSMQGLEGQIQPENLENKPADVEKEVAQLRSKDGECKNDKHERPLSPVGGNESMSDEPPGHQQDNDDDKTDLKEKHHLKSQTSPKVNVADSAVVKDEPAQPISSDRGSECVRDVASDQQGIVGAESHNTVNTTRDIGAMDKNVDELLVKLELKKWFPCKISLQDVTAVNIKSNSESKERETITDIPWLILQRLIIANKDARDRTVDNILSRLSDENQSDSSEEDDDINDLCPLDVFIVVFHCCDAMLKQFICKKMFMCRLAVPLLYKGPSSHNVTVSVWPLRSIVIEWMDSNRKSKENIILEQPTKVIAFARFGRPMFSKSKLQNDILSDQKHDTFFNKDCPLGMSDRSVSLGYVETSWYLPAGNTDDLFDEVITFANVRGDISVEFCDDTVTFLQRLATMFVLVIDVQILQHQMQRVTTFVESLQRVIIVLTNSGHLEDRVVNKEVRKFQDQKSLCDNKIVVVLTHKRRKERNASDMEKTIRGHLVSFMKELTGNPLSKTFNACSDFNILSDEECHECIKGKELADALLSQIRISGPQETWKAVVTPLQHIYWKQWSALEKELQRPFSQVNETEIIKTKMRELRKSQFEKASATIQLFTKTIISNIDSKCIILYYIEWIKSFLDDMSRCLLPDMRKNYNNAWDELKQMKSKTNVKKEDLLLKEEKVRKLEHALAEASFGIEHIFREMGQIYEAQASHKQNRESTNKLSEAMAKIVLYGHSFELLDGDACNTPTLWVESVLRNINNLAGCKKIMTMSVLGIQSSGKSTLLNTMFGLQFSVSAGRCTRGVYMQLIPIKQAPHLPFEHVMVIDSEGLRAPELLELKKDHDNELATFVIGLGDITLLNIKGENTSEINDILEITVHAFLRLKATNTALDLKQICVFAHQNVAAINATDKMKYGVQKLVESLDKMTIEAAQGENIHDITTFSQVITFDGAKHVWYLPDLWQGDPPMAATNVGYSTKVKSLRTNILKMATTDKDKSYKCMEDIVTHAKDLWKGICAEDFVFSFKNSLEIKAYLLIEKEYKHLTWELEYFIQSETQTKSKTEFSNCKAERSVDTTTASVVNYLNNKLDEKSQDIENRLKMFFEKCDYQEIIINWKQTKLTSLAMLLENLKISSQKEIKRFAANRKVELMLTDSRKEHEERLHKESIELASSLKERDITQADIEREFEIIWTKFVEGIQSEKELMSEPIQTICINLLRDIFSTDKAQLSAELTRYKDLAMDLNMEELSQCYGTMQIENNDISKTVYAKLKHKFVTTDYMQLVHDITNDLFRTVGVKLKRILQENSELGNTQVTNLLRYVTKSMDGIIKDKGGNWGFTLKTSYKIKVYVYISCHIETVFERHNQDYLKVHGIKAQLKEYKENVYIRFKAHLENRKAEGTAAELFIKVMKTFIVVTVAEELTLKVKRKLVQYLPDMKYTLIIDVLTDLVEKNEFVAFLEYIATPYVYASEYISRKSLDYLFNGTPHNYAELAFHEIAKIIKDIESQIENATKKCHCIEGKTFTDWIQTFSSSFDGCSEEKFRDIAREDVVDFGNFKTILKSALPNLEKSVKSYFETCTKRSVKWANSNPITLVFDKTWGCKEICPMCGETCTGSFSSASGAKCNHSCIQHRPSGVNGIRDSHSSRVSLSSCNFDIQSNATFSCGVLQFRCNSTRMVECSLGMHPYKEYRKFLPSWTIAPSGDMESTCKLWLWFMAKYKDELAQRYKYIVSNIPKSWNNITKEEALESLKKAYDF